MRAHASALASRRLRHSKHHDRVGHRERWFSDASIIWWLGGGQPAARPLCAPKLEVLPEEPLAELSLSRHLDVLLEPVQHALLAVDLLLQLKKACGACKKAHA